jgi:hypothetical protein
MVSQSTPYQTGRRRSTRRLWITCILPFIIISVITNRYCPLSNLIHVHWLAEAEAEAVGRGRGALHPSASSADLLYLYQASTPYCPASCTWKLQHDTDADAHADALLPPSRYGRDWPLGQLGSHQQARAPCARCGSGLGQPLRVQLGLQTQQSAHAAASPVIVIIGLI